MGYIRHHAIIVTSWNKEKILESKNMAENILNGLVSPIIESRINGYCSFFIAPDGSKEGWVDSDIADGQRELFIKYLNQERYEDGSSCLSWAEISLGSDDDNDTIMLRHRGKAL